MIHAWLRYGAVAAFGGALTWFAVAQPQIAGLERDMAKQEAGIARQQAQESAAALSDLEATIRNIRASADGYQAHQSILAPRIDALAREIKNAPKPLPADCRPDDFRVRNLRAAVDAANQGGAAAAAGQPIGRAVPGNSVSGR